MAGSEYLMTMFQYIGLFGYQMRWEDDTNGEYIKI